MQIKREPTQYLFTGAYYLDFLLFVHTLVRPDSYLEIGTRNGDSLKIATCDAAAVDPNFNISSDILGQRKRTFLFQETSDAFFRRNCLHSLFPNGIDLIFLDGLHRFEFLLRDFMNSEKHCHDRSLLFVHDILPANTRIAGRVFDKGDDPKDPTYNIWAGDAWKIVPILKQYRPELKMVYFDCPPTGIMACYNLNHNSSFLDEQYYNIIDDFSNLHLHDYGFEKLFNECPIFDSKFLMDNPFIATTLLTVR